MGKSFQCIGYAFGIKISLVPCSGLPAVTLKDWTSYGLSLSTGVRRLCVDLCAANRWPRCQSEPPFPVAGGLLQLSASSVCDQIDELTCWGRRRREGVILKGGGKREEPLWRAVRVVTLKEPLCRTNPMLLSPSRVPLHWGYGSCRTP